GSDLRKVAEVACTIAVLIGLIGVGALGAIVARITGAVPVPIGLVRVGDRGAVVVVLCVGSLEPRSRADPVAVRVVAGIAGAGIADGAERVAVRVGLIRVGVEQAVVAGVGRSVTVRIGAGAALVDVPQIDLPDGLSIAARVRQHHVS